MWIPGSTQHLLQLWFLPFTTDSWIVKDSFGHWSCCKITSVCKRTAAYRHLSVVSSVVFGPKLQHQNANQPFAMIKLWRRITEGRRLEHASQKSPGCSHQTVDPEPDRHGAALEDINAVFEIAAVLVKRSEVTSIKRTETQKCNVINLVIESLLVLSMFVSFCCKDSTVTRNHWSVVNTTGQHQSLSDGQRETVTDKTTGRVKQQQPRWLCFPALLQSRLTDWQQSKRWDRYTQEHRKHAEKHD